MPRFLVNLKKEPRLVVGLGGGGCIVSTIPFLHPALGQITHNNKKQTKQKTSIFFINSEKSYYLLRERQTDRQTDRQTEKRERQTDKQTEERKGERQRKREREREKQRQRQNRERERERDRDRETDRETDRDRESCGRRGGRSLWM